MNSRGRRINPYREVIFQGDTPECGLVCIAMFARIMGRKVDLDQLRDRHQLSPEGLSLQDLVSILDGLGLESAPVKFDEAGADALPLPAIVHYGGNHFVVASERIGKYVRILNPATGAAVVRASSLSFRSTGYAVIGETEAVTVPVTVGDAARPSSLRDIVNKRAYRLFATAAVLLTGMALAVPALVQGIWNRYIEKWGIPYAQALGIVAALFVFTWLIELWFAHALPNFAGAAAKWQMPKIFKNLMVRPLAYFELASPGQVHQRFMAADKVLGEHAITRIELFVSLVLFAASVVLLFVVSKPLACISAMAFAVIGLAAAWFGKRRASLVRQVEERQAGKSEFVLESIAASHTIRTGELAVARSQRFAALNLQAIKSGVALLASDGRHRATLTLIANLELLALLAVGRSLVTLSYGAILTYAFLRMIAMSAASRFSVALGKANSEKAIDRLAQGLLSQPRRTRGFDEAAPTLLGFSTDLVLKQLVLRQGAASSPDGFDIRIKHRSHIGVVGASGAGKTTFLKIVAGLKPPAAGSFSVDGGPACGDFAALRPLCYMSATNDKLLRGTVLENVLLEEGRDKRTRALQLLEELGLGDLLRHLPQGADTQISEERPLMSSGQRQRLFIARALCSSKPILLFDEPTANLDVESARRVIQAIATCDRTTIVAMHEPDPQLGIDTWIDLDDCALAEPRPVAPCTLVYAS